MRENLLLLRSPLKERFNDSRQFAYTLRDSRCDCDHPIKQIDNRAMMLYKLVDGFEVKHCFLALLEKTAWYHSFGASYPSYLARCPEHVWKLDFCS